MCQTLTRHRRLRGALQPTGSRFSLRAVLPNKQCVVLMISPLCKTKDLKPRKDDSAQSKGRRQALNLPFSDSQGRARVQLPGRGLSPILCQMGSLLGRCLSSAGLSCGNREVRSPWAGQGGARHCSQVRVEESGLMTGCSSATPSFPSQPEGKIGLPRANPRGRLRSPS